MKTVSDKQRLLRMIITDALALGIALLVFAFFHHVKGAYFDEIVPVDLPAAQTASAPENVPTQPEETVPAAPTPGIDEPEATPVPDDTDTPEATDGPTEPTPEPTPEPTGLLKGKYTDKFSAETVSTDTAYRSKNVAVELTTVEQYNSVIHVLDIYLQDISSFRAYIPRTDGPSKAKSLMPIEADEELGGVIAVTSSDQFYGHNIMGYIVRNGKLYNGKKDPATEALVMYNDGTMATFSGKAYDPDAEVAKGVCQTWSFGPSLLDNGQLRTDFSSSGVAGTNPRMAIGYFEPGHYCLVEVDGARNSENAKSKGVTLEQLSEFMYNLGCKVAYNLDGGATAGMVFNGQKICKPGRRSTDLLYICEPVIQ